MKRAVIFVLFLAVSMLSFAVAPVLAAPSQKIPVTARTFNQVEGTPEKEWTTDGGITHVMLTRTGNVTLTIDGQAPITGALSEVVHMVINTKTGEIVIQNFEATWTFAGGSFEGVKQTRVGTASQTVDQHVVFQGSGSMFDGCTLMLSQEAPPFPPIYRGFLLLH